MAWADPASHTWRGEMQGNLCKITKGMMGTSIRKIFVVCNGKELAYWRSEDGRNRREAPLKRISLGPQSRVEDTGLQRITERKELYTLALHYTSEREHKKLLLGSKDPEIIAAWRSELGRIRAEILSAAAQAGFGPEDDKEEENASPVKGAGDESLKSEAPEKDSPSQGSEAVTFKKRGAVTGSLPRDLKAFSATVESVREHNQRPGAVEAEPSHGVEAAGDEDPGVAVGPPTRWRIAELMNGLRVFEEQGREQNTPSVPCMKAVSRVNARADAVFRVVMDLSKYRTEWDDSLEEGRVVESVDGHTDIIYSRMGPFRARPAWLAPRDFCLIRNWRREEDGTYVVLYRSTSHSQCPERRGIVRGNLLGGGYIITPLHNKGRAAATGGACLMTMLVELGTDSPLARWVHPMFGIERAIHMKLLMNVAGIRDLFDQVSESGAHDLSSLPAPDDEEEEEEEEEGEEEEEFFGKAAKSQGEKEKQQKVERKGQEASGETDTHNADVASDQGNAKEENGEPHLRTGEERMREFADKGTLRKGHWPPQQREPSVHAWCEVTDPNQFYVRSKTYLTNKVKQPAGQPVGRLVAVDWFVNRERIDSVCTRPEGIAQKHIIPHARETDEFLFCVNIQVPGSSSYSIVFYYLIPAEYARDERYLFARVLNAPDSVKDAHFKLIPSVTKGAWVVKRSVGTKPLIVGGALKVRYVQSADFLECDVDVGSSAVASSVVRFVMNTLRTLVIDLALLMESKEERDLPERLIGTLRVAFVDPDSACRPPPPG